MKCFNIHSNCAQGISYLPLSANYGATGTKHSLLRGAAHPQVLLKSVRDVKYFTPLRRYTLTLRAKTVLRKRWQVFLNLATYRHQHPPRPNIVLNPEVTMTWWMCCLWGSTQFCRHLPWLKATTFEDLDIDFTRTQIFKDSEAEHNTWSSSKATCRKRAFKSLLESFKSPDTACKCLEPNHPSRSSSFRALALKWCSHHFGHSIEKTGGSYGSLFISQPAQKLL